MKNSDLIDKLKKLDPNADVWVVFPNDDQSWPAFLTVRESDGKETDINLEEL